MHHPVFEFEKWRAIFPIETFEKREGPRRFSSSAEGSPIDLWKASGDIVTSPSHLCEIELVRERVREKHNLGRTVPVDTFIWRHGAPDKPYLTKFGGVPHREKVIPWPIDYEGNPFTFVAQFCFLDSRDIVSSNLPGDVMLIFFYDSLSHFGYPKEVRIEWSSKSLQQAMTRDECPEPQFPVPELAGEIHRCNEYPDSRRIFEQEGHYHDYWFATTQSTKIGRETFFIQNDARAEGQELICALSSVQPASKWPFTNMKALPYDSLEFGNQDERDLYEIIFGDMGCMYFKINDKGEISWASDCY